MEGQPLQGSGARYVMESHLVRLVGYWSPLLGYEHNDVVGTRTCSARQGRTARLVPLQRRGVGDCTSLDIDFPHGMVVELDSLCSLTKQLLDEFGRECMCHVS